MEAGDHINKGLSPNVKLISYLQVSHGTRVMADIIWKPCMRKLNPDIPDLITRAYLLLKCMTIGQAYFGQKYDVRECCNLKIISRIDSTGKCYIPTVIS